MCTDISFLLLKSMVLSDANNYYSTEKVIQQKSAVSKRIATQRDDGPLHVNISNCYDYCPRIPFSSGQSSQEALFNVSPLVLILVIITVFMELFAATLCFFNCYLCTSNSVLSFILIFFIYLLFSLFPFPSPLFGTSLSGKIKASTLCTFFSFITTITIFAVLIVILHLAAIKNVKKLLSR